MVRHSEFLTYAIIRLPSNDRISEKLWVGPFSEMDHLPFVPMCGSEWLQFQTCRVSGPPSSARWRVLAYFPIPSSLFTPKRNAANCLLKSFWLTCELGFEKESWYPARISKMLSVLVSCQELAPVQSANSPHLHSRKRIQVPVWYRVWFVCRVTVDLKNAIKRGTHTATATDSIHSQRGPVVLYTNRLLVMCVHLCLGDDRRRRVAYERVPDTIAASVSGGNLLSCNWCQRRARLRVGFSRGGETSEL